MNLLEKYKRLAEQGLVLINFNEKLKLYTIKYTHGGVDFSNPLLAMARGLTLDANGKIILRGFTKFFNYKQLDTYDNYTLDFKNKFANLSVKNENEKLASIEKLDGSLTLFGAYNDTYLTASTSSTESYVTDAAYKFFNQKTYTNILIKLSRKFNLTFVFEYISPSNQIGILYKKTDFVLIGIIDNLTGQRIKFNDLLKLAEILGITSPNVSYLTLNELTKYQRENKDTEGFVIENEFGNLIKFKTEEWFKLSKNYSLLFGNKLTKRKIINILNAYQKDEIDDLLALQNQTEGNTFVSDVLNEINRLNKLADDLKDVAKTIENKDVNKTYNAFEASIIFNLKNNKPLWSNAENKTKALFNKQLEQILLK